MEATIVLVLLLTFLVGGMVLALAMGYRSVEEGRAQQKLAHLAETRSVAQIVATPGFFTPLGDRTPSLPSVIFDDALLAQLERHVRAEQATVAQFVHFPSVDSLYSKSGSSLRAS